MTAWIGARSHMRAARIAAKLPRATFEQRRARMMAAIKLLAIAEQVCYRVAARHSDRKLAPPMFRNPLTLPE